MIDEAGDPVLRERFDAMHRTKHRADHRCNGIGIFAGCRSDADCGFDVVCVQLRDRMCCTHRIPAGRIHIAEVLGKPFAANEITVGGFPSRDHDRVGNFGRQFSLQAAGV